MSGVATDANKAAKSVQQTITTHVNLIKQDLTTFVENVKNGRIKEDEVRWINSILFGLYSFFALLYPPLLRFIMSGFSSWSFTESTYYTYSRVTDEFIRLSSVATLVLLAINYMSSRWTEDAKKDVFRLVACYHIGVAVVSLLSLWLGASYVYVLVLGLSAGVGFLSGKMAKLF